MEQKRFRSRADGRRYRQAEDTEAIGVRLHVSDLRQIDEIIAQSTIYNLRSDFIRKAVRAALNRHNGGPNDISYTAQRAESRLKPEE